MKWEEDWSEHYSINQMKISSGSTLLFQVAYECLYGLQDSLHDRIVSLKYDL